MRERDLSTVRARIAGRCSSELFRVGSIRSIYRVRRIDAIPRAVVDERELLARRAGAAARWRPRRYAEMLEDAAGDVLVLDEGDQAQRALAPRTGEHVDGE